VRTEINNRSAPEKYQYRLLPYRLHLSLRDLQRAGGVLIYRKTVSRPFQLAHASLYCSMLGGIQQRTTVHGHFRRFSFSSIPPTLNPCVTLSQACWRLQPASCGIFNQVHLFHSSQAFKAQAIAFLVGMGEWFIPPSLPSIVEQPSISSETAFQNGGY
jgi:hypothetical protein